MTITSQFVVAMIIILKSDATSPNLTKLVTPVTSKSHTCMETLIHALYAKDNTLHFITYKDVELEYLHGIRNPVIMSSIDNVNEPSLPSFNNYIVYANNETTLMTMLNDFMNGSGWHPRSSPRGTYVIVITEGADLKEIFRFLWQHKMVRVILVTMPQNKDAMPDLHVWKPFDAENRCGTQFNLQTYSNCLYQQALEVFNENVQSLFGCTIKMVAQTPMNYSEEMSETPLQGFVTKTLLIIGEHLQADVVFETVEDPNMEMLNNTESDVIIITPAYYRSFSVFEDFDYSNLMFRDRVYWLVPSPNEKSKVLIITTVLSTEVWLCVLISYLFTTFAWYFVGSFGQDTPFFTKYVNCFFSVTAMNFAVPIKTVPTTTYIRVVMFFYLFLAFHIIYAFQGRMSSVLLQPIYEDLIDSSQELLDSSLMIYANQIVDKTREISEELRNETIIDELTAKMVDLPTSPHLGESVHRVANKRDCAFGVPKYVTKLIYPNEMYDTDFIDKELEIIAIEVIVAIIKAHPFLKVFNRYNLMCFEGGFPVQIFKSVASSTGDSLQSTLKPLEIDHFRGIFYLWLIALLLATVCFITENFIYVVYKKYMRRVRLERVKKKLRQKLRPSPLGYYYLN